MKSEPFDRQQYTLDVERCLNEFVAACRNALGETLRSVVLFGSAADGQLRATSDVNLLVITRTFDAVGVAAIREPMRLAHAQIRLSVMFVLDSELPAAIEAFAVKFDDIVSRHRVLYGDDPFASIRISESATLTRLNQVLLNLAIRLRHDYVLSSLREEQAALIIADAVGPLRASAAALLRLEARPAPSPKAALEEVVAELGVESFTVLLSRMSTARESVVLEAGVAGPTMLDMIALAQAIRARVTARREANNTLSKVRS